MPGMFDGFPMGIFDDSIFDTVFDTPPALRIRQRAGLGVPPDKYSVRVIDV